MSDVALEIRLEDASTDPLCNMIGAGGASSTTPYVFEVMLSYDQWLPIRAYLDSKRLPYKVAESRSSPMVRRNNPQW